MRRARGYGLGLALIFGLSLGALPLSAEDAAAQATNNCSNADLFGVVGTALCLAENAAAETGDGGDADANGGNGGRGGNGGFAIVSGVGNASAVSTGWSLLWP